MRPEPFDLNKLEQRIKETLAVKNNPTVTLISLMELIKISQEPAVEWLRTSLKQRISTNTEVRDITEGTLFEDEVDELINEAFPDLEDKK